MTRDVLSLAQDRPLESAAWALAAARVSGAPVRDRSGRVIGVLSKSDLVDAARKSQFTNTVEEAMTPGVWAVHPDDPAIEAVRLMVEKEIHRLIVLRGPGKLEGLVTTTDVMRALLCGHRFDDDDESASEKPEARRRRSR
jgi:predicted transcriptional regulator